MGSHEHHASQSRDGCKPTHLDARGDYSYRAYGSKSSGEHRCLGDYSPGSKKGRVVHCLNADGSYSYTSPTGSRYVNNGKGESWYIPNDSSPIIYRNSNYA